MKRAWYILPLLLLVGRMVFPEWSEVLIILCYLLMGIHLLIQIIQKRLTVVEVIIFVAF